jgi:hypothetical protein
MKKLIARLRKRMEACPINLPWMIEGLDNLDGKYETMCRAFEGLRDELKKAVNE